MRVQSAESTPGAGQGPVAAPSSSAAPRENGSSGEAPETRQVFREAVFVEGETYAS